MVHYVQQLHVKSTQTIETPQSYTCTQVILYTVSELYNVQQLHLLTLIINHAMFYLSAHNALQNLIVRSVYKP
jgi:hypothetical protein